MNRSTQTMARGDAVWARWRDLLLYGLVAAALWGLLGDALLRLFAPVHTYLAGLGVWRVSLGLIALCVVWAMVRSRSLWRVVLGSEPRFTVLPRSTQSTQRNTPIRSI